MIKKIGWKRILKSSKSTLGESSTLRKSRITSFELRLTGSASTKRIGGTGAKTSGRRRKGYSEC
jgi:hypothetical protein